MLTPIKNSDAVTGFKNGNFMLFIYVVCTIAAFFTNFFWFTIQLHKYSKNKF